MSGRRGGLGTVLALQLRTSWLRLVLWIVGIVGVYAATLGAIDGLYPTAEALETYGATLDGDPTIAAINGIPYGATNLGGVTANEFGFIAAIALPLMALSLVVGQTRAQEESGLLELLRSRGIGARAPWVAAFLVATAAFVVVGLGIVATALAGGVDAGAVGLYALSLTALGMVFAALATFVGQFVRRGARVTSVGVAFLGIAFVARGVGNVDENAWKWLSPLAWQQETRPFDTDPRWWPLLLALGVAAALATAGLVLVGNRDLGAAFFGGRPGPARASRWGRSSLGLAVRAHLPAAVAWAVGAFGVGAVFGTFGDDVTEMVAANPELGAFLGEGEAADQYSTMLLLLVALMSLGLAGQGVGQIRAEETTGRIEPVLARSVSRVGWLATRGAVVAAGAAATMLAGGVGVSLTGTVDGGATAGDLLAAAGAYVPAVLVLVGLGVCVVGVAPRLTWFVWLGLAYVVVVDLLGDTLDLPDWARALSPVHAVGRVPSDPVSGWAETWLAAIAVVLFVAGLVGFRRRDVPRT
ncbi:ABC transporter permease [Paraoerskovia marina]|uniref:ABC transporter permease n=1 Tax=Paraoerskovia marina TaxID=545619 RepID=UPI000492991E|nr:ABC transporter permease [Paraoerskovia marina]